MCLDVEGVFEFKTVHSKDHPDEVAESLSAYGGGRLVTGITSDIQTRVEFFIKRLHKDGFIDHKTKQFLYRLIPNQDDSTFYLKYTNIVTPDAPLFQATVTPPNASLTTISNLWSTKQHLSSKTLHVSSTSLTNLDSYLVTLSLSH